MDDDERARRIALVLCCLDGLTQVESLAVLREVAEQRAKALEPGGYHKAWLTARNRLETIRSFAWVCEQSEARKKVENASQS
jgi:hypothetical protein